MARIPLRDLYLVVLAFHLFRAQFCLTFTNSTTDRYEVNGSWLSSWKWGRTGPWKDEKQEQPSKAHGGVYGPLLFTRTVVSQVKTSIKEGKSYKKVWTSEDHEWLHGLWHSLRTVVSLVVHSSNQVWRPTLGKIQGKTTEGFTVRESLDGTW